MPVEKVSAIPISTNKSSCCFNFTFYAQHLPVVSSSAKDDEPNDQIVMQPIIPAVVKLPTFEISTGKIRYRKHTKSLGFNNNCIAHLPI